VTKPDVASDRPREALPPPRAIFRGIGIGLVIALLAWIIVLGAVGGAAHHFSFAP
jgi:hypothetical protein